MKRKICLSISLVFIIGINALAQDEYKSDRIFVRFIQVNGQQLSQSQKTTILTNTLSGSKIMKSYSLMPGLALVQVPDGVDVPSAISRLNESKLIEYAEPVYYRRIADDQRIPNDEYFSRQWGMNNAANTDINAPEAWFTYQGNQNFIVAVLDSGADFNHPDLKANLWLNGGETPHNGIDDDGNGHIDDVNGWDVTAGTTGDNDPCDTIGHGTHVAGIIGAVGDNTIGVAGVNWKVSLMTVKIFPDRSQYTSDDLAVEGIMYALINGAHVINASWGGPGYSQTVYSYINLARSWGVLFVAAAGNNTGGGTDNDGYYPVYPASYDLDNIISVMATNQFDNRASFSNYGFRTVDLAAPGNNIYSTVPTRDINVPNIDGEGRNLIVEPNTYAYMSGTSMAAPHVAGACAFVWSFDWANLDYTVVRNAILLTVDQKPALNGLCVTGGRLNLQKALEAVNTKVINTRFPAKIYRRIQLAIDDPTTINGDTLIAQHGYRFYGAIDFKGKKIKLRSGDISNISDATLYPEDTYIVATNANKHAVTFDSGEDSTTSIKGFTIMNGFATGSTMFDRFGGGIYCSNTSPEVNDCNFVGNSAHYDGGGIYCDDDSNPLIVNCTFNGNSAAGRDGGAIYCYDSSPTIKNCLIINNTAAMDGGGIYFNGYSPTIGQPKVINCTIVNNSAGSYEGLGGALYCYYNSKPTVKDCIFSENENYAIFEEDTASDPVLTYSMFYDNPDGDYYDADTMHVYTGASAINAIPDGQAHNNITSNPAFARGRLGNYYLSWIDAGQLINSIAVNGGSTTAAAAGLNKYTTRTDNTKDSGQVDIGFHYYDTKTSVNYTLKTIVAPTGKGTISPAAGTYSYKQYSTVALTATASNTSYQFKAWHGTDDDTKIETNPANGVPLPTQNNIVTMDSDKSVTAEFENRYVSLVVTVTSANGSVSWSPEPDDPRRDLYLRNTVVTLTGVPSNPSYRAKWTGTDDDTSSSCVNMVTMTADKEVLVEFYAPRTLIVGGGGVPGAYTNLGEAIADARDGDVIQIHEGQWLEAGYYPFYVSGKAITIRSTNPDDPCVVARTILYNRIQFENVGRDTVLAGVTIRDVTYFARVSSDGGSDPAATSPPYWSDCDGYDGTSVYGGGLRIGYLNQFNAIYQGYYSTASPTIINCVIRGTQVWAGDGGNGVTSDNCSALGDGGWGGKGYGGGVYIGPGCKPLFKNVMIRDCNAIGGDGGNPGCTGGGCGYPGSWGDPTGATNNWYFGPYDEVWKYSGHGGGAYCDIGSAPEFIDCNFINNTAQGGSSGNDTQIGFPHSRIDSYGGAVYCAANSSPIFTNCRFVDNIIDANGSTPLWRWTPKLITGENVVVYIWDKYFGYGGAVAGVGFARTYDGTLIYSEGGQPVFENCTFTNNQASNGTGGAMHWMRAFEIINKSTFTDSIALHGGALYLVNGTNQILESTFTGNTATDVVGEGGAIFAYDANTTIADSNISSNTAVSSGGGVFISGSGPEMLLRNDLIRGNTSGRDGGGVSVNTYADVNIANCTISGNVGGKYGGGLYCSYNSFTSVIDSIIWGNFAVNGPQIAIGSSDPYNLQPSVVEVSYSDIGPRYSLTAFDPEQLVQSASSQYTQVVESQTIETELANNNGWAKIVITLDEPTELRKATNWGSSASVATLRAEISLRQEAVLSTLTSNEFQLRYRCKNTTTFSGLITASGLNKLTVNPQVSFIEPVRQMNWAMKQGLNLTNGMGIRPTYSGSGVAVAICDSGVDYRHSKLGGGSFPNSKVIGGYDFGSDDADPLPDLAHGTCCAGIAAGDLASVGDYIGGVAYNAKIYALQISVGTGGPLTDAAMAAWDWCITHKNDNPSYPIVVISNSWGGDLFNSEAEADAAYPAEASMAATVVDAGITIVAASGNDYATGGISVPAALSNVISVGAVYDVSGAVIPYSDTAAILDVLAPSDPTYTTDIIGSGGYAAGDYDPYFNGTSAACPFAAGTVAVIQSAAKQTYGSYLTPAQIRAILTSSGDLVTDTKVSITKPRVNIGATINSLMASPIYIESGSRIEHNWWNATTKTWQSASHNLDVNDDPLFVEGYYLSQIAAGESVNSDCVDAGHTTASTAGMYRHTTRTDLVIDALTSPVDLGYHYVRTTEFRTDLNYDGIVDAQDLLYLWLHWLETGCEFPDWCQGADLTEDGIVNFYDLAILATDVNEGLVETTPPEPNPMTWDVMPTSAPSATWATMTATKAKDAYGGQISYYFQRTNASGVPDGFYRNWDPNRRFYNTGLTLNQTYGYRVKARDFKGNETGWSVIGYVTVGKESPPNAPTNLVATAVSNNQINLTWTDNSSNETGFKIQRKTGTGSFAQIATVGANVNKYNNTGLTAGTTYTYRVIAYNTGGDSLPSNEASVTTLGGGGTTGEPNQPVMISGTVDPNCTQTYEADPNTGVAYWFHTVVATVPDIGGGQPVWFRFVCTSYSGFNSAWISGAGTFPMYPQHPISANYPNVEITLSGTTVTYRIAVKEGGAFGWPLDWKVCASYNATGTNSSCSNVLRIPWH